ncbi:MAG: ORF6N domain-containing protein [Planctomycetota bacterium]
MTQLIPVEKIENKILHLRGKKVMFDEDLALLYEVETKQLKRQVRRNIDRFPDDFMFERTQQEYQGFLRRQFGTLKRGAHSKYLPYAFTEQGVAMLSSVLNSKRAILVNIQIMRAFAKLRREILTYTALKRKIEDMEKKYDTHFRVVFQAIKQLMQEEEKPKSKI